MVQLQLLGRLVQRLTPKLVILSKDLHPSWLENEAKMKRHFLQRMGIFHECNHGFFGVHRCSYVPTVVFFRDFPLPFSQESTRPCERRLYLEARWALWESFTLQHTLMTRKMTLREGKEGKVDQEISFRGLFT